MSHICGLLMRISEMTDNLIDYSLPLSRRVELRGGIQYVKHQPEKTSKRVGQEFLYLALFQQLLE